MSIDKTSAILDDNLIYGYKYVYASIYVCGIAIRKWAKGKKFKEKERAFIVGVAKAGAAMTKNVQDTSR